MKVVKTKIELEEALCYRTDVGFIPTMGALHQGHVSLVEASVARKLFTVVSIFVNPTQFNDPKDYEKYPVDTSADLAMLEKAGCDLAFLPSPAEIYPPGADLTKYNHQFGYLETRFEGAFRPGHFRGVGQVVHILFELVKPKVAFFGEKDFQQLAVIRALVAKADLPVQVIGMITVREPDGLAMSSRNRRLNADQRLESTVVYKALQFAKESFGNKPLEVISAGVSDMINQTKHIRLEYFGIIDPLTFEPISDGLDVVAPHAVIAVYAGDIRLIDNLSLVKVA